MMQYIKVDCYNFFIIYIIIIIFFIIYYIKCYNDNNEVLKERAISK